MPETKKKPGRPKGSKNKPPEIEVLDPEEIEDEVEEEEEPQTLQVTGNTIRETLKIKKERRLLLYRELERAKTTFEDQDERDPGEVLDDISTSSFEIAMLQSFQAEYNQRVQVQIPQLQQKMSITFFVKAVDGTSQQLRKLKEHLNLNDNDRLWGYGGTRTRRGTDEEEATVNITDEELFNRRMSVSQLDASYRAAIAKGNGVPMEVPEILQFLFVK